MTGVDFSLLIGLLVALWLSAQSRRAAWWLLAAAGSYVLSTVSWRLQWPMAEVITALGDAAVCLCVYFWARYRWEMWVWRLCQISVAISTIYLASRIGITSRIDHDLYATALEAVNWILLISIGGSAALQRLRGSDVLAHWPFDHFRGALRSVWDQRSRPAFHKA